MTKRLALGVAAAALAIASPTLSSAAEAPVTFPFSMAGEMAHEFTVAAPPGHGVHVAWDGERIEARPISAAEVRERMTTSSSQSPTPAAACWNALWNTTADVPLGLANVAGPFGGAPGTCRTNPGDNLTRHSSSIQTWEFVTIGGAVGTNSAAGGSAFAGDFVSSWFTVDCVTQTAALSNVAAAGGSVPAMFNCKVQVRGNPPQWNQFGARVTNRNDLHGNISGLGVTGFVLHGI